MEDNGASDLTANFSAFVKGWLEFDRVQATDSGARLFLERDILRCFGSVYVTLLSVNPACVAEQLRNV